MLAKQIILDYKEYFRLVQKAKQPMHNVRRVIDIKTDWEDAEKCKYVVNIKASKRLIEKFIIEDVCNEKVSDKIKFEWI